MSGTSPSFFDFPPSASLPSSAFRLPSFLFVGGKGGVGKTTCAAALAIAAARRARTLLISTDPASSLGDALGVRVTAAPRRVPGAGTLDAVNVDAAHAFERWIAPRRALLATIALRGTYLDEEDVGRLLSLSLPGIDEVMGLLEIARVAARGYDHVVVDTAPTGHTLRLLSSPALLERAAELLDAVHAHHRAVVDALRGGYARDEADALIEEIDREGRSLAERLRDPAATNFAWVTLPEPMALEETMDAIRVLDDEGIRVARLIVNRMTPPPPDPCRWCRARRRFEARAIAPVARRLPGTDILVFPQLDTEPRGLAALRKLAAQLRPAPAPASLPQVERRVRAVSTKPVASAFRRKDEPARTGPVASAFRRKDEPARTGPVASAFRRKTGPRWILFGGKGGVGKSTCAAAFALYLASRYPRRAVLLVSSDPAHSLGDVLGARVGDRAAPIPGGPANLRVREIDAAAGLADFRARYLASVDEVFTGITRGADTGGDLAAFRQLIDLAPPGIDEVIAIADVGESLADHSHPETTIVSDTAPTGHALRLLQTPAVMREWTQALMALLLKYREIVGTGSLAELLVQLSRRLRALERVLRDPSQARFVIVTRPAALPREETLDLTRALDRMGITVGGIIVNAVGAGTCRRCRHIEGAQAREMAALRAALDQQQKRRGSCAIIEAAADVPPPHGAAVLAAWTSSWRRIT